MRISDWSSDVCSSDLAIGSFEDREEARAALGAFRKILRRFGFAAILLSVAAAIYGFYGQKPTAYIIAIWPLLLLLSFSHEKIKDIFKIDHELMEVVDFLVILSASSLAERKSTRLNSSH